MIHRPEQVDHFLVAPVGKDGFLVTTATPVAAAIVDRDDHVSICRKQLAFETERMFVLSVRSAMDAKQRGVLLTLPVGRRLHDQAVHFRAVLAGRGELLSRPEKNLRQPFVVLMRQPAQLPAFERGDFRRLGIGRR